MSETKKREKERLNPKAFEELRQWLTTMPLSIQNPLKNLHSIADFIAVAAHLQLPQNSRILELGAGSCWPSEWLYRMGYRTVSGDISLDMLRLGRERFLPLRREKDNYALFASFVCSDAEHLPFADGSFDAVIVFNAFHHFPDPARVLSEVHRVLADPGRFVLAEPGEGHSESDEAKREMAEHGVLERDIVIDEVADLAAQAGFTGTEIILSRFPDTALPFEDWRRFRRPLRGWRYKPRLLADLVRRQRTHPCLVLKKGSGAPLDSRRPGRLRAELTGLEVPEGVQAGHPFRLRVRAGNCGDTRWMSRATFLASGAMNLGEGGYVNLGVKLLSEEGETVDDNFGRGHFADDVPPEGETGIEAMLRAPEAPGRYLLKLDLVDEGIAWFEDSGSRTAEIPLQVIPCREAPVFDSRFPDNLEAEIRLAREECELAPGGHVRIEVRAANRGNTIWRACAPLDDPPTFGGGYVRLGWQLRTAGGKLLDLNYGRSPLSGDVMPGESVAFEVTVKAPADSGDYRVVFDFVDEQIAWFSEKGSPTATLRIKVR